jgi:hypothetical protein
MTTPSKMYMISGSLSTASAQTQPFMFDTSTNFPSTVYSIDSTTDGYIAFYLSLNGLYIVSTAKNGMAYGIDMSINKVYKLASYSTTGNPTITTDGVVDSPALYSNATHQFFSIRFNSLKDLYAYSISPATNPILLCIPFTTRVNGFTGQTTTAGYVHAIYTFSSLYGVYSFAFQPNTNHIFLCFTNMQYIAALSYSGVNDTSKYGLTVKYYSNRVITDAVIVSKIAADALSCCFDENSNLYYTNGSNVLIYTANSSGSVVLNYALNNSSFYGPFYISLTGITRAYSIEFDASNNLFVGNISGSLNVIIPASTTATVFGTVINSYTMIYNSSMKNLIPPTYNFFDGGAVSGNNVNVSSATSGISTMAFSLDKRTKMSLFFPGAYGVRTIVNIPTPPSYCVVSSPSLKTIQVSGLLGTTENNYNKGIPLTYNYYSIDNVNYTQIPATQDTAVLTTNISQNTVYLKSNNIVGNSNVYSVSIFVETFYPCFLEGTRILRMNPETDDEEYIAVEKLKRGDLIKTANHGYKAIELIGSRIIEKPLDISRQASRLYWFRKSQIPGLREDLCVTGDHCILHKIVSTEKKHQIFAYMGDIFITEDHYRVPAFLDDRAEQYEDSGAATIWHFALENANIYHNYGVWANGLLVESSSLHYMYKHSNMKMV